MAVEKTRHDHPDSRPSPIFRGCEIIVNSTYFIGFAERCERVFCSLIIETGFKINLKKSEDIQDIGFWTLIFADER